MKVRIHNKKTFNYIVIIFISIIFSIPLFSKNLDIYNNMGYALNNMGAYDKALEFYEKALAIREDKLGKDHS